MKDKDSKNYKVVDIGGERVLKVNYEKELQSPSIENNAFAMANTINLLLETGDVSKIVFTQRDDYVYDSSQTKMLVEIAELVKDLVHKKNVFDPGMIGSGVECPRCFPARYDFLRAVVMHELREDPISAYFHVLDRLKKEKIKSKIPTLQVCPECNHTNDNFIKTLEYIESKLGKSLLIKAAAPYSKEYVVGDRDIYSQIFRPLIKPNFLYTKVVIAYPKKAEEINSYKLGDSSVVILKVPGEIRLIYHIIPPEFKLAEQKYNLLGEAREILASHKPKREEFIDPKRTREVFLSVERDLLEDLFRSKNMKYKFEDIEQIAEILIRHTIGFGVLEVVLSDEKIQDISVNAPAGRNPVTVIHQDYGECLTNISITPREVESWATKLRLMSGRPLDEANPVLDTELLLPNARARVSVIQRPLSPKGLAFSFRRHRNKPWTLPLFINNKMINELAAGLLSFLIDGNRTFLIAGTRSSGKTSMMGSFIVEIMRKIRTIVIEDTLELPISEFKKLNYDIQSMKVRSAIVGEKSGISAEEGIRTSLRMGDSALIVGEVRSVEAKALFEAMRVGALANVVAGTIHGDSPYGVFDRIVNDLGVPRTSFKAADIIVIANPIKTASGLESERRVIQITEVRKDWEKDPLREKAFVNLMEYNSETDQLEPTDALIQGDSEVIKAIAARIREFAGDYDAVWKNIKLRANIKKAIVEAANKLKRPDLLESDFVVQSNDEFHRISQHVLKEFGNTDSEKIYAEWEAWFKKQIKLK